MQKLIRLYKSIYKYLVAAVILGVPLYPKFPLINISGTFVAIRLEDFLIALLGLLTLLYLIPKTILLIKDPIFRSILIFIIVGFLSVLSAAFITKSVDLNIALFHWLRRIEYLVPFFAGILSLRFSKKNLKFYFNVFILTIILAFVYGYGQKNWSWPIIITQNEEYSRGVALRWITGSHINSTFAGHYDLATYLVLFLPIIISATLLVKRVKEKVILTLTYFSGLWLLVNSASRISILSYLVASSVALIFIRRFRYIPLIVIATLIFAGFSTNLLSRYTRLFDVTREKLDRIVLEESGYYVYANENGSGSPERKERKVTPTPVPVFEDRSTSIRLNVEWPRALRAFTKNPLLGTGYSSITLATDNDYLRLFGEVGLLGFFSFFLIFLNIGYLFLRKYPFVNNFKGLELAIVAGTAGSLVGVFSNAFFIDIFEASKFAIIFWLLLGMVVYTVNNKIYE